ELENKLKTFNTEIPKKNYASKDEHIQELKRVIENLEFKNILLDKNKNKKILKDFKNIKILFHQCRDFPVKKIQEYLVSETKEKNNFIIVFYSINENKISLAIKISNDITKTYKASDLIKKLSNFFGQSKGGGK
ncbi:MAG: DHHA1 domain-containing protein, partial [Candidatus Fonsibacter sp.]